MSWEPADLYDGLDGHTWRYTRDDRHFWPPEGTVPPDAKLIIDVGANAGLTTGLLAEAWPEATVIGIEMDPYAAERGRKNLIEFGERTKIITGAVGWPERKDIMILPGSSAVNHLKQYPWDDGAEVIVDVQSLDNILYKYGVLGKTIDFMKMDIEGAEWEVLHDGGEWAKHTKVICVEGHYKNWEEFEEALNEIGFDVMPNHTQQLAGLNKRFWWNKVDTQA